MAAILRFAIVILSIGTFDLAFAAVASLRRDGSTPALPFDPNSSPYCTWWVDLTAAKSCADLFAENAIDLVAFRRWNPSITANCALLVGRSYCVEAFFESAPTATPLTQTSASASPPAASTQPSNGIVTPQPTQPQIVGNCDKFHLVQTGQFCSAIASIQSITLAQFYEWNPSVSSSCSGLSAGAYACVSIINYDSTPTQPGNGISTPSPIQAGMVTDCARFHFDCARFHFVAVNQFFGDIAALYSITTAQFSSWNLGVGSNCGNLWSETFACVGLIGSIAPAPPSVLNGSISGGFEAPWSQSNRI